MTRTLGLALHRAVEFTRALVAAVRHVRTGGRTTRTAAQRRADRPPRVCRTCHRPLEHSRDWRDHLGHTF